MYTSGPINGKRHANPKCPWNQGRRSFDTIHNARGAGAGWRPTDDSQHALPDKVVRCSAASQNPKTILVVDDDFEIREFIRRILVASGFLVLEAANGQEALSIYDRPANQISLVITDIVMPWISGHQLSDRVNQRSPNLPILFMSGFTLLSGATNEVVIRSHALEIETNFLQKPFSPSALRWKVRDLLDRAMMP